MLQTHADIQGEVLVRANRTTTDSFITDQMLQDWERQAHNWAVGYKKWPFSEGRASTTFASLVTSEDGWLAGEYPEGWKSDSIRVLTIGGVSLQKKAFTEFQKYLEQNTSASDKIYTDFARRYYVNPNSGVSGSIVAWGIYTPTIDPTDAAGTTCFTYNDEDGNDAIVEKMLEYEREREHLLDEAAVHAVKAEKILEMVWAKIAQEQYNYGPTKTDGMWKRIDIVEGEFSDEGFKRNQF